MKPCPYSREQEDIQNRLRDDAAETRTRIMGGAGITGDLIRARTAEKDFARTDATLRGQTLQSLGQEAKIYAADANDVLSTPAKRKIAQGNLDDTMKEMKRIRGGGVAEPTGETVEQKRARINPKATAYYTKHQMVGR